MDLKVRRRGDDGVVGVVRLYGIVWMVGRVMKGAGGEEGDERGWW